MSHHYSGPTLGSPMGTPASTSPICMPSPKPGDASKSTRRPSRTMAARSPTTLKMPF
jgi:hypothetical protein